MESARVQESIRREREGLAVPLFNQVLNWTPATEAEAGLSTCGGERAPSPRPPAREGDGTGKNAQPSTLPWNKNGEGNAVFLNWLQDQKTQKYFTEPPDSFRFFLKKKKNLKGPSSPKSQVDAMGIPEGPEAWPPSGKVSLT